MTSEREVYGIDSKGRIYRYQNKVTFEFFKRLDERRMWIGFGPKIRCGNRYHINA